MSDVFGKTVVHEKATPLQKRRLSKSKLPLSIRRLYQDECRELKRKGLENVMKKGGRILRNHAEDKMDHLIKLQVKTEKSLFSTRIKQENYERPGKIVTVSLMDNEVELTCDSLVEKEKCWVPSKCNTFDVKPSELRHNDSDRLKKLSRRTMSTRSCPLVKVEQNSDGTNSENHSSNSWNSVSYSSPLVAPAFEPEQSLPYVMSDSCQLTQNIVHNFPKKEFCSKSNMELDTHERYFPDSLYQNNNNKQGFEPLLSDLYKDSETVKCSKSEEPGSVPALRTQNSNSSKNAQPSMESYKKKLRRPKLPLNTENCKRHKRI